MTARTHIVGAGLAGLSAAVTMASVGRAVTVHEAGPVAGGRCRSYFDRELGLTIDNGNHLLLSGNGAAFAYLDTIGARDTLGGPPGPLFPFVDVSTGERWVVHPNSGRVPWWIFMPSRRVPGTRGTDYLMLRRLSGIADDRTVADALPDGPLYRQLIEPLAIAALNTPPQSGLARALGAVVRETLMQGGAACIPRFPRESLTASLIDPAISWLGSRGVEVRFARRITGVALEASRVTALHSAEGALPVGQHDAVILAVPPWIAGTMLPEIRVPTQFEAILNVHFRVAADPGVAGFIGVLGGTAEWVFVKQGHVSVTISAANRMVDRPPDAIAAAAWPDVCKALGLAGPMPPYRVVKERRATFAATATQDRLRPGPRTPAVNLMLAGDWTATGLPATIEGAIRSGRRAADLLLAS